MHATPGQSTNAMQKKNEQLPHKLPDIFLKIRWQFKIPDTEILKKTRVQSIHSWLIEDGPVMSQEFPMNNLLRRTSAGKRSKGGKKKRYKENLKI